MDHDTFARSPQEVVEQALHAAVQTATFVLAASTSRTAPPLDQRLSALARLDASYPDQVDRRLGPLLDRAVRTAVERGWQPTDLGEYTRRRLGPRAVPLLVDALAAEHARYPAATTDPRWQEQLDAQGARIWWDVSRPPFPQWVRRHGLARPIALRMAVTLAGLLLALPRLPRLLPVPGTATGRENARPAGVDAKVPARIRALLAKAESTEFPDEAEALSAKAQELMARFSLDRALVEADAAPERPADGLSAKRIWVEAPYVSAKTHLVGSVASANRCRAISHDRLGFVTVLGAEVDIALVEVLATSLLVQAGRAMLQAGSRRGRFGESRTRSFRQSFLVSYSVRIGERLREAARATEKALDQAASARLLPVLARRDDELDRMLRDLFPDAVRRGVSVTNAEGWAAGRTAADLARLDARRPLGR